MVFSAIRAREVRAADLQEKPTKRLENLLILRHGRFVGFDEDGAPRRTSQRAKRAIGRRAKASEAIKLDASSRDGAERA